MNRTEAHSLEDVVVAAGATAFKSGGLSDSLRGAVAAAYEDLNAQVKALGGDPRTAQIVGLEHKIEPWAEQSEYLGTASVLIVAKWYPATPTPARSSSPTPPVRAGR